MLLIDSIAGSMLYGLNLPGSDQDTMGIMIGFPESKLGLHPHDQQGKDDHVVYELAKAVRLILNGNPTVIQMAYVPQDMWLQWSQGWPEVQEWLQALVTERSRSAFLGYLEGQRQKLIRDRGQRQELKDQYGYDTKFAMHMVRLGMQGVELHAFGKLQLPMGERKLLLDIRQGKFSQDWVLTLAGEYEKILKSMPSVLPTEVDTREVDKQLVKWYRQFWGWTGSPRVSEDYMQQ